MTEELKTADPVPVVEASEESPKENTPKIDEPKDNDAKPTDSEVDKSPAPPPKPPRPLSPFSKALTTLKEAFPDTDEKVIRAVLVASKGDLDSAFNALLSMNDPDFKPDNIIPRASIEQSETDEEYRRRIQRAQIEEDERLARQLAGEYRQTSGRVSRGSRSSRGHPSPGNTGRYDDPPRSSFEERSFFEDELPEIRENLQRGFNETKTKVTSWVNNFKKRLDTEGPAGIFGTTNNSSPSTGSSGLGRTNGDSRREQYYGRRFERDPNEIDDDFRGISLQDNSGTNIDSADSDLYAPPVPPPKPARPVVSAFGDTTSPSKVNKWESLKSVDPEPEANDKDPFFIGESDDDEEPTVSKETNEPKTDDDTKTDKKSEEESEAKDNNKVSSDK